MFEANKGLTKKRLKGDYTIIDFGEVTEVMMREMVSLIDSQCFPDEQHDPDYESALYKKNKHTLCALYQDEKIIGYIEMLPLTELACNELAQGSFDVEMFGLEHIAEYKQGLTNATLYVRTLAVLPGLGKMTASVQLISKAAAFALKLVDEGIKVNEMLAYFTNEKLEKILARKGFKQKYISRDGLAVYSLPAELIHLFV